MEDFYFILFLNTDLQWLLASCGTLMTNNTVVLAMAAVGRELVNSDYVHAGILSIAVVPLL